MRRGDCVRRWPHALFAATMAAMCLAVAVFGFAGGPSPAGGQVASVAGALVICGGGPLPDEVRLRFLELAGGEQARLVVIPTASLVGDNPDAEPLLVYWRTRKLASLKVLHTQSRDVANDPAFSAVLEDATGVWFSGGDQNLVTAAYLGTKTEERLHALLGRGGVIGGTSAGAAIMSRVMIQGGRDEPRLGQGLGFLTGTIVDQHFLKRRRQHRLLKALTAQPGLLGLGIDEGTAAVVQGTKLTVLGRSQVCVCRPRTATEPPTEMEALMPGQQADLLELCGSGVEPMKPMEQAATGAAGQ